MILDSLLESLYIAFAKPIFSRKEIIQNLENVLEWLSRNNNDENCKKIDSFMSERLTGEHEAKLPRDIYEILFDMGGTLHDTHSAPDIARNFASTPEQLLERVHNLKK